MPRHTRTVTLALSCVALLFALGACYTTKFSLGPREQAAVDRKFVGNWELADPDQPGKPPIVMLIRNIDDHEYYVEYNQPGDDKGPQRFTGYIVPVKGVSFAHLRPLSEVTNLYWNPPQTGGQSAEQARRDAGAEIKKNYQVNPPTNCQACHQGSAPAGGFSAGGAARTGAGYRAHPVQELRSRRGHRRPERKGGPALGRRETGR